jgi:hypothetical protein
MAMIVGEAFKKFFGYSVSMNDFISCGDVDTQLLYYEVKVSGKAMSWEDRQIVKAYDEILDELREYNEALAEQVEDSIF